MSKKTVYKEQSTQHFSHLWRYITKNRTMNYTGIIIAACTFLTIGIWHPIVIKTEYYWGTRPWIVYLIVGLAAIVAALFIEDTIISSVVGVFGASALWGIGELFEQKKRVERGWFPKNPRRQQQQDISK
jgi:hypothetical protein